MKVILNCHVPFMLAHGGMQIQIEQTEAALEQIGVEVEHLRWWDDKQTGDILHHFGSIPSRLVTLAHGKGWKVAMSAFMSSLGAQSQWVRLVKKAGLRLGRKILPRFVLMNFPWDSYVSVDACIAMTPWEAHLMQDRYGISPATMHVVPNGVEEVFFASQPSERGQWLVCTATIIELKQVLKLAQAAAQAETPLWVIGKPFSETDEYAARFVAFARQHPAVVRYEGAIMDRRRLAAIYREARGFVLLSRQESMSLSTLEAAACECQLLLSDSPWARTVFGNHATYCPPYASIETTASFLRNFYDSAPNLPIPPRPLSWLDVAKKLKNIYESLGPLP